MHRVGLVEVQRVRLQGVWVRRARHLQLVFGALVVHGERCRHREDRFAVLDCFDAAGRERSAIAGAVDEVDDLVCGAAGSQEVPVQRVDDPFGVFHHFLPLTAPLTKWAAKANEIAAHGDHTDYWPTLAAAGYELKTAARRMEELYDRLGAHA